jgi:thiamine-monophosphate kinase
VVVSKVKLRHGYTECGRQRAPYGKYMNRTKPHRKPANEAAEDLLVDRIRRALATAGHTSSLRVAIGDDAAVWHPTPGHESVLTCDWFLEGTHFLLARHPARSIGWKCLARAVSDLAAMGATPRCFLLSLALPTTLTGTWLDEFLRGLCAASRKLDCPAAGGDITRRDQVLISMTAVGECRRGRAILRNAAQPGDAIFVSGRLGESEYGLRRIQQIKPRLNSRDPRLRKHLYPQPRLAVGAWLAQYQLASAMMDLSDGLSTDLPRLCQASGVGVRLEALRIPPPKISAVDAKKFAPLSLALHGGDDYELLFTVRPKHIPQIPRRIAGIPVTLIGRVVKDKRILLVGINGQETQIENKGWDPFKT